MAKEREGERRERGENPSSFRMEPFDFINESNRRRIRDALSFLILRFILLFLFFLFSRSSKPSPIYDAPRALVDVSPDRLKNHYRETIWMGRGARGTRGKYLDGFNRGSFKSQRHEPPVHRACLSSETSEGDKIDLSGPFPLFLSTKPRKDSREIEILLDEKIKHRP